MITQEFLISMFDYSNGNLYWKITKGSAKKGSFVGKTLDKYGYRKFMVNQKSLLVHRAIFLIHHGYLPEFVDHFDGNKLNNAIENLREATLSQNAQNRKTMKTNKTGIKNVCWVKSINKWRVQIFKNGKHCFKKDFIDLELAELVATEARDKFHGKYANHGE